MHVKQQQQTAMYTPKLLFCGRETFFAWSTRRDVCGVVYYVKVALSLV